MNERIQALIDESITVEYDMVYDGVDSYMETHENFDKEKFAQLIVKQCMAIATGNGSDFTAKDIAEHFGVEDEDENPDNDNDYYGEW